MGGRELAEKLRGVRPGVPLLFASGYTDDFAIRDIIQESDTNFIQKPFSLYGPVFFARNGAAQEKGRVF
jgi:FixJ family two-component response regulator